jgi:hypothetical protein
MKLAKVFLTNSPPCDMRGDLVAGSKNECRI